MSKWPAPLIRIRASRAWCILLLAAQSRVSNITLRIRITSFNYRSCWFDLSVTTRATHHGSLQGEQKGRPRSPRALEGIRPLLSLLFHLQPRKFVCLYLKHRRIVEASLDAGEGLVGRSLAPPFVFRQFTRHQRQAAHFGSLELGSYSVGCGV